MEIRVEQGTPEGFDCDALIVLVAEGNPAGSVATRIDAAIGGHLQAAVTTEEFTGKNSQSISFPAGADINAKRVIFCGIGSDLSAEVLRRATGRGVRQAASARMTSVAVCPITDDAPFGVVDGAFAAQAIAEAACAASYRFTIYKTDDEAKRPCPVTVTTLLADASLADAARVGRIIADGMALTMDLANHPSAVATPTRMADEAAELAREYGMTLEVLEEDQMMEMGMGGMIGVGAGSEEPSKFIVLHHKGSKDAPVVLVGKTITFDTGGISIKPSLGMEEMKGDMSGGAAVLGTMRAVGELDLPVNVVAILVAAENMPSGSATNPGDVLHMLSGHTVEVINTDAEGRLVLADGIAYAKRFNPKVVVDIATLTGAAVVALGHHASGILGTCEASKAAFKAVGEQCGERVWELPLWPEYRDDIKSDIADIKNTGGRAGGTITAGCFLQTFAGDMPWVHLDIAATAWSDKPSDYLPKGSTGVGVRLMTGFLRNQV